MTDEFNTELDNSGNKHVPEYLNNENEIEQEFIDVLPINWSAQAINFVSKNNIMVGYKTEDGHKFKPNQNITREEIAVAFYKFAKFLGKI